MGVAQLALDLDLPLAKELLFAAADKGDDDADVLSRRLFFGFERRLGK